jgi:hypothetical protein
MNFLNHRELKIRKMLDLQHQYNNCTTTPHMTMDPTHWDPPSCEIIAPLVLEVCHNYF